MTTGTSGAERIVEILRSEGVTHVFGNPGSTEMPFIDAIAGSGSIAYILGLHENCVIAMAEGYALASGRPAVVNVHTMSGLGNSIGMLTNARVNGSPLIVTAGHQDQRFLLGDPLLSHDLTGMTATVSKWQHEARNVDELAPLFRRAFNDVMAPPRGPVFVSMPISLMAERTDAPLPPPSAILHASTAGGLDDLARLLVEAGPEGTALVLGIEVPQEGAIAAAQDLAESLGAAVYGAPNVAMGVFPPAHPLWNGVIPALTGPMRAALSAYRRVLVIGGQALQEVQYEPGGPLPPGVDLLHLSSDPAQIGRTHPTAFGTSGALAPSLAALARAVRRRAPPGIAPRLAAAAETRRAEIAADENAARAHYDDAPLAQVAAIHAALQGLPADGIVVDEAVSGSHHVRTLHRWTVPGRMFSARQIIGWGMPAAVGAAIAHGGAVPVLSITSDGGATFSPQAVWTAARERLPVVFVVLVNREYGILKKYLKALGGYSARTNATPSCDLVDPPIDYVLQARSYGVEAHRLDRADAIAEAVRAAFARGGPVLLELAMAP